MKTPRMKPACMHHQRSYRTTARFKLANAGRDGRENNGDRTGKQKDTCRTTNAILKRITSMAVAEANCINSHQLALTHLAWGFLLLLGKSLASVAETARDPRAADRSQAEVSAVAEPRRLRASTMSGPCLNLAESASSTRESVQALRHESKGNGINFCHAIFGRQFRRGMRLTSRKCPRRAATRRRTIVTSSGRHQHHRVLRFSFSAMHHACHMPRGHTPHACRLLHPTTSQYQASTRANSNHGEQKTTTDLSA